MDQFTRIAGVGFCLIILLRLSAGETSANATPRATRSHIVEADLGICVSDHDICSDLGRDVLQKDGNAVDAAVAIAFCQGVVSPAASGIGGGSFILLRLANGHAEAIDMRETAPGAASENMYGSDSSAKKIGGLSVGVPGEIAGLHLVWKKYGKLPWESLLKPAIRLAANGFAVRPYLAAQISKSGSRILSTKGLKNVFAPNGTLLRAGEILYRKSLAKTLSAIARHGPGVFYNGTIGKNLVRDVQAAGGIMTFEDLQKYEVKIRKPVVSNSWGYTILGMPPPSAGGAGLALVMNILGSYHNASTIQGNLGVHHIVEAFKHTYATKNSLGDPDFENVDSVLNEMLSPEFAAKLQQTIVDNTTFEPIYYGGISNQISDHGTSHSNIVDSERNAVAITTTINYPFGSLVLSESTGVLLNNEMNDFSTPTDSLINALPPAKQNFIKPYKRPLSTMSPTIILENGQLRAVLGGSGGIKILTAVAQVLLNHISGLDPLSAVTKPRVHHQLQPNWVAYENFTTVLGEHIEVPLSIRQYLHRKGHKLQSSDQAVCQLVLHDLSRPAQVLSLYSKGVPPPDSSVFFGKLIGVSDPRKDGYPAGY